MSTPTTLPALPTCRAATNGSLPDPPCGSSATFWYMSLTFCSSSVGFTDFGRVMVAVVMADLLVAKGLAGHVVEHGGEERGELVTGLLQARVRVERVHELRMQHRDLGLSGLLVDAEMR